MQNAVAPGGQRQQPACRIDEPDRRLRAADSSPALAAVGHAGLAPAAAGLARGKAGQTVQASGPMSAPWLTRSAPAAVTTAAGQSGSSASSGRSAAVRAAAAGVGRRQRHGRRRA